MRADMKRSSVLASAIGVIACWAAGYANAQTSGSDATKAQMAAHPAMSPTSPDIQMELERLRDQVRKMQQRLDAGKAQKSGGMSMGQPSAAMPPAGASMGRMRMMDDDMMKSEDEMMGKGAMGGANSAAAMAMPSGLPGFPGQSHLYHIGASGFFLDYARTIALTTEQQQQLAGHKQKALLRQGDLQRQIESAEEKLWQLTAADQPEIRSIDDQVRTIERLRADKRIAFIRAVGEAAKVLTNEQRSQLTGTAAAAPADAAPMSDS